MTTVGDRLRSAAGLVESRGWHRCGFAPPPPRRADAVDLQAWYGSCPVDILGALNVTFNGGPFAVSPHDPMYQAALVILWRLSGSRSLSHWNDAEGRTSAEVVALLRSAADVADAEAAA